MTKRVTVAVPVYNGMPFLKATLDAILSQSYTDLDVVVIDNCSTDDGVEYTKGITDPRVRFIQNETNLGLDGNWNKSLKEADRSPYFKIVCADDIIFPDSIQEEVAALEANPEAVMTASQRKIVDEHDKVIFEARGLGRFDGLVSGRKAISASVASGTNIFGEPTSVMLRSSVVEKVGEFDSTNYYCIDLDYWIRALTFGDLVAIRKPLAAFRVASSSASSTIARKQRSQAIGEFKKLAADKRFGVSRVTYIRGAVMATALCEARMVLYRWLAFKNKRKS